jgi:Cytochrome c
MNSARLVLAVLAASLPLLSQSDAAKLERGKYIVEEVARCEECHTPRMADGTFDHSKWLKGTVQRVQPIEPIEDWHKSSPDLTRTSRLWMRWGDKAMITFLTTGLNPGGKPAGAPMPSYKMKTEDAEAVVDYLKSLQ